MKGTYAAGTKVSVARTIQEIERLLVQQGAKQRVIAHDDEASCAMVIFTIAPSTCPEGLRQVRVGVPLPRLSEQAAPRNVPQGHREQGRQRAWEQACRERWRGLLLLLKAKFTAIHMGVSSIEREFLADIALPDGRTVHAALSEGLRDAYRSGTMPALLARTNEHMEPRP